VISGSVADTQAAACWLVVNGNGNYAYAANAADNAAGIAHFGEVRRERA